MKIEAIILIVGSIISLLSLIFIPKNMFFQAQFIFNFVQLPSWILGILAVQLGFIEYPFRELSTVNRTSFVFEYLALPILCIHFYVHFPRNSSIFVKCLYSLGITLMFTIIEYFVERYTFVLTYTGWQTSWTFLSMCFIFLLSYKTTKCFFR